MRTRETGAHPREWWALFACVPLLAVGVWAEGPAPKLAGKPSTFVVTLVAGGGTAEPGMTPQPATQVRLKEPFGVAFDKAGLMYIVEMTAGQRVLVVDSQGQLTVLAGDGQKGDSGDDGPTGSARTTRFNGLHAVIAAPDGSLLLADTFNNKVRRLDLDKLMITTVAGSGEKGFGGDGGPARLAKFAGTFHAALNPAGDKLYIADLGNRRVRRVDLRAGTVETVAGNGERGRPVDGAMAVQSPLMDPRAVSVDSRGRLYILERDGHALRVVEPDGRIRTVVNALGTAGNTGDGGPAHDARLNGPKHICIDPADDSVLIADAENHLVRRYNPADGTIVRVAGTGKKGAVGVGASPLECQLNRPHGVSVHPTTGRLYITDSYNHRILRLDPAEPRPIAPRGEDDSGAARGLPGPVRGRALLILMENGGVLHTLIGENAARRWEIPLLRLAECRGRAEALRSGENLLDLLKRLAPAAGSPEAEPNNWRIRFMTVRGLLDQASDIAVERLGEEVLASLRVADGYDRMVLVKGHDFRPESVRSVLLELAAEYEVDVHVLAHGFYGIIYGEEPYQLTRSSFFDRLRADVAAGRLLRGRIRSLYQMNCRAGSLTADWRDLGVQVLNGTRTNADNFMPTQYFRFLEYWLAGYTFLQATDWSYHSSAGAYLPVFLLLEGPIGLWRISESRLNVLGRGELTLSPTADRSSQRR